MNLEVLTLGVEPSNKSNEPRGAPTQEIPNMGEYEKKNDQVKPPPSSDTSKHEYFYTLD